MPTQVGGDFNVANGPALDARNDLTAAYVEAAGRSSTNDVGLALSTTTLAPGVHTSTSRLDVTGAITLDGLDDPDSVFIFQVASDLDVATNSSIVLINGAQSCNVFWQVGASAQLMTGTSFVGTVMALTSVTVQSGTTVDGRVLARNGAVTLDNNVFTMSTCDTDSTAPPSTSTTASATTSPSVTATTSATSSPTSSDNSDSGSEDGDDSGDGGAGGSDSEDDSGSSDAADGSDNSGGGSDNSESEGGTTGTGSGTATATAPVTDGSTTVLAQTGTDGERLQLAAGAAGLLVIAGAVTVIGARRHFARLRDSDRS